MVSSNVRCVVSKYNSDGVTLNSRKFIIPNAAIVNRDGERAVDSAQFKMTASENVTIGDTITYLQDVVDTSNLRFVQMFQEAGIDYNAANVLAVRDESGNDIDMACTNTSARFGYGDNGNRMIFASNGDECVANTNNPQYIGTSSNILDFSGMFDIYIRFFSNDIGATAKYLLNKMNPLSPVTGIAIYIVMSGASGTIEVDMNNAGILTSITGTAIINDNTPRWLRLVRDQNNDIKLYINGVQDGSTVNSASDYTNTTQPLILGNNNVTPTRNRIYKGSMSQVRIYCGANLTSADDAILRTSRRILQVMKFGGTVWKIDDGTDIKTIYCKAFSQLLTNTQVNPSVATNLYQSKTANVIITDVLKQYSSSTTGFNFTLFDNSVLGTHSYSTYVANGSLVNNIIFFCLVDNLIFRVNPRRTVIVETNQFNNGDGSAVITFKNTTHNITDDGHDDTNTTNDLETVFGTIPTAVTSEAFVATASQTVFTVTKNPFNTKVDDNGTILQMDTTGSPAASTYVVDYYNKTITISTGRTVGHTITIVYSYEDPTAGQAVYFRINDGTSITQNGRHFKRITLQGVYPSDLTQVNNFTTNYITKFKDTNQRITVNSPTLINSIRENMGVNIIDNVKRINTTNYTVKDINGNDLTGNSIPLIVYAITWNYPSGTTDIHVGSYLFDAYDLDNVTTDQIQQSQNAFIRNKTA